MADKKLILLQAIESYNAIDDNEAIPLPSHTEFRIDKTRRRFDYAYPEYKILIEIHGGIWSSGRHTRGKGFMSDRKKMNDAQLLGYIVLEFPVPTIEHDPIGCAETIAKSIEMMKGK